MWKLYLIKCTVLKHLFSFWHSYLLPFTCIFSTYSNTFFNYECLYLVKMATIQESLLQSGA